MMLELAQTNELIDELKRRYPLFVVAGCADATPTDAIEIICYQGNILTLLGLANVLQMDLLEQYHDSLEETNDTP